MTQSINLGVALGASHTAETIGYRLLNMDNSSYASFTTTNVAETTTDGTYVVTVAVTVPDAGARIVWGVSGTDYWNDIIDPSPVLPSATLLAIADAVLGRSVATVEGTAGLHSLTELILGALESSAPSTTWTIKKTDGTTTFNTRTLTEDAAALPVTGVS